MEVRPGQPRLDTLAGHRECCAKGIERLRSGTMMVNGDLARRLGIRKLEAGIRE